MATSGMRFQIRREREKNVFIILDIGVEYRILDLDLVLLLILKGLVFLMRRI